MSRRLKDMIKSPRGLNEAIENMFNGSIDERGDALKSILMYMANQIEELGRRERIHHARY